MLSRLLSLCVIVTFSTAAWAQDSPEQQAPEQQNPQQQQAPQQQPAQPAPDQQAQPEQAPQEPGQPQQEPGMMPEDTMPEQQDQQTAPGADIPDDLSTPRSALKVLAEGLETGDAERIREVIHAENDDEERMKGATIQMAESISRLRRAALSQFGPEGARPLIGDVDAAMEEGMQRLAQAEETIDDDTAVVSAPDDSTPPVTLRLVDDKWRVPMSELHQGAPAQDIEQPLREMQRQAQVIQQVASEMRQYQTAEEAAQALRSRMMETAMTGEEDEMRERPAAERQEPTEPAEQPGMPQQPEQPQEQPQEQPGQQPQPMPQPQQ